MMLTFMLGGTALANTALWKDFPENKQEVGLFIVATGVMQGYPDGTFRPYQVVTEEQVVRVIIRAGIRTDLREEDFYPVPAKMGWVDTNFLPGTVLTAKATEDCTRFRLAVMLSRYRNSDGTFKAGPATVVVPTKPVPVVDARIAKMNQLFKEHPYNGKITKFVGHEKLFLQLSAETGVPIWLSLAQAWKESCWGTNGSSIWGIKGNGGFVGYDSTEASIRAYYKLIRYGPGGNGTYWKYLQAGNIDALVELYAPSYENSHSSYMATLWIVKGWVSKKGL